MRRTRLSCRIAYLVVIFSVFFVCVSLDIIGFEAAAQILKSSKDISNNKTSVVDYIKAISPLITKVDITIRNIGLNMLSMEEGVKAMDTCITQIELLEPPKVLFRQHKSILLSFRKLRMGLLLLSSKKKDIAIKVIKSGTRLLKYAATDMVDIAKEEGLIKEEKDRQTNGRNK